MKTNPYLQVILIKVKNAAAGVLYSAMLLGMTLISLPVFLLRFILSKTLHIFRPDLARLVPTRSAVLGIDDPYSTPQWNLSVWLIMDGAFNFDQYKENFYSKMVLKRRKNGSLIHPEFQQYFEYWFGFLFWKWDKRFNIDNHMKYYFPGRGRQASVNEAELKEIIKELTWAPFKKNTSPWEFQFIPDYQAPDTDEKQSILFFRVHHGFCDGFCLLQMIMSEVNDISLAGVAEPKYQRKSWWKRSLEKTLFIFRAPYHAGKMLVQSYDQNDWHLPSSKIVKPMNMDYTEKIPLSLIKQIKNKHNVSYSAVVYAAITAGIKRMMVHKGIKVPDQISTALPFPIPRKDPENTIGNKFIFSFSQLPISEETPTERLKKAQDYVDDLKYSEAPMLNYFLLPVIGSTFTWLMRPTTINLFSTVLVSNFPGPPETTYFIGAGGCNKVTDMNFGAGCGQGRVGLAFLMLSYDHSVRIVSQADPGILSTKEITFLNKLILEELDILLHS